MHKVHFRAIALTLAAAAGVAAIVFWSTPTRVGVHAGRADENYLSSTSCRACHVEHYKSWARTFHSRMTQEARASTVQGDFSGETFDFLGVKATTAVRDHRYWISFVFPDGNRRDVSVDRLVGSRRIEQYLTRREGGFFRLPIAYDLVNRRWMSLNGSFFHADSENYSQHEAQWDANCVFCHNVKAQPHIDWKQRTFATEVTELGIACGACHGQGAAHADLASSPIRRTWWRWSDSGDVRIVQPAKLSPERSVMVCGHCHGQRIPNPTDRIQEILTRGDPFNAGDDLGAYYSPVWRETTVGNFSFAARFWNDGSPRLTAYEYQGLLRSRCYSDAHPSKRITCLSCHSMHEGDPRGQLIEKMRTNAACIQCHEQYSTPEQLAKHTHHTPDSSGSSCYNCHMPRVVYGVMSFHPTHEISVPDPTLTATKDVPNACSQCHLEKSLEWTLSAAQRLWPGRFGRQEHVSDPRFTAPEAMRALFSGDALTRALAADALGGSGPFKPDPRWAGPLLVEAFSDNYPIVRFFAAQGLSRIDPRRRKPDYLGTSAQRESDRREWLSLFDPRLLQDLTETATRLRRQRVNIDIEVGE